MICESSGVLTSRLQASSGLANENNCQSYRFEIGIQLLPVKAWKACVERAPGGESGLLSHKLQAGGPLHPTVSGSPEQETNERRKWTGSEVQIINLRPDEKG